MGDGGETKKWIHKFFPNASHKDAEDLLNLWNRITNVSFPQILEPSIDHNLPTARILETGQLIGEGRFGAIHKVKLSGSENDQSLYAMKSSSSRSYIQHELGIHSRLDHPHIVKAIAYAEIPRTSDASTDKFCIVMELMDGSIDDLKKIPLGNQSDVVDIMLQAARGLFYMHSQSIMHRDVKPGNILFRRARNGRLEIKISDFGTYRFIHEGSHVLTAKKGTKCYWAPEVVREADVCPYTTKADVYSFAMTCYAALTGKTPFQQYSGLGSREFHRKIRGNWIFPGKRPKLPDSVHPSLAKIVKQCWHSNPEERPSMKVVCWALEYLLTRI